MFRVTGCWIAIFFLFTPAANPAFGQGRVSPQAAPNHAQAPFMLEAESHEESQRVTKTVFKNGLTAMVYESHAQPLVSIRTYVSVGFLDDPAEMTGLSDLTARARANVGEGSPAGAIRRRARSLGGVFHGRAASRYSSFEITVPAARWKQALGIQAEAMLTPFENSEAFRFNAARIAEDMPDLLPPTDVRAREELLALAFGERRFSEPGDFGKIPPEKIIEFHKNRYVPSAITLVVAGDVRAGDVLNEAVRVFVSKNENAKNANAGVVPPKGIGLKPAGEFRYRAVSGGAAFPGIFFGFPVPSENSEDYRTLEAAAAILGIGETSVLNTRLRDLKGLVFTARAKIESFDGAGLFSVGFETELKNIDRTEIAFWTEVEILKKNGPSDAELARAIAQLERLWWERRETVGGLSAALAGFEFQGGWKRMDGYIAEIRKITATDVKRAVGQYITLSNCALLENLPLSSAERNPSAAAVRGTIESLLRSAVNEELAARVGETEPNYKIPPAGAAFRSNEIRHSFQSASILRGPEIYIREDHATPLLEMGFFFTGGKAQESAANEGVTGIMLELMLHNERENRQLEIYGGCLTPVVTDDYFGFFLSIPARNSSAGFERIKQAIKSPVFDGAEIERLGRLAAARARTATSRNEALLRGRSYVAPATLAGLKNISAETIRNWHEENVRNVKPFVAIIGDTEGTSLASWFVSEFSGSRMKERKSLPASSRPARKTEAIINDSGDVPFSAILLGFQAPSAGDADVYGTLVLKSYLEFYLREIKGTSKENKERDFSDWRIACEYQPLPGGGSFVISAATKAGAQARDAEILRKEIARLVAEPLSRADFQAALALTAGLYIAGNQTRKAQIENLTKSLLAGLSLEEYQNFPRNIEQVGEEDFRELMRRILDTNEAKTMVFYGDDR